MENKEPNSENLIPSEPEMANSSEIPTEPLTAEPAAPADVPVTLPETEIPSPEPELPEPVIMEVEEAGVEIPSQTEESIENPDHPGLEIQTETEPEPPIAEDSLPVETESAGSEEAIAPEADHDHDLNEPGQELLHEINQVLNTHPVEDEEELIADDQEAGILTDLSGETIDYDGCTREELVKKLEELVHSEDINGVKTQVALIKVAFVRQNRALKQEQLASFIENGGVEKDFDPIADDFEHRFNAVFDIYKEKKLHFTEELERQKQVNLEAKLAILDELRELIGSEETLKKTYDEFRELQEKWRRIGIVPKTEVNTLWQNYHFLVEKFFDKVKINKELKDLDLKKNLESKIELCERAEELLLETNVMKSFKELQKLHEQWKEIGPVPSEKKDEIWERFKSATDKINNRRREHYDKLHVEFQGNYESKLALIEKAREISETPGETIKQWQDKTNAVNELFKIWKSVGPAPRKVNDEVWQQFKQVLDVFFGLKSEFFSKIKEQQLHNYNLKLDLCLQAEALMNSTDWRAATKDLINLQKEWKQVGPVPRKHSDKIWKRFRSACDHFFKSKEEFFSTIHDRESDNLKLKEELIRQVEEYPYTDNKQENLKVIKEFQRKWVEIGYVPIKDKDRLQNDFRRVVDKQLDKLKISALDMNAMNYKSRFENTKESAEGSRTLLREISFLQGKVQKMAEDVALWENNLGFLANSKNADILRQEFDRKIQKARQEIKLMEAKIKFLREELNK